MKITRWGRGVGFFVVVLVGLAWAGPFARAEDREFRRQVRTATERGRSFLLRALERKRRRSTDQFENAYPMGFRALLAYALLEAGVEPDGPEMASLFGDLSKLKMAETYSVSLYVMALDARERARRLAAPVDSDRLTGAEKDQLTRKERIRLEAAIGWLIDAKWPERGTWGYGRWQAEKGKWEDYSNTQFAVLALEVGRRRGYSIPSGLFREVMATFEENGWATGPARSLAAEGPGWWEHVDEVGGAGGATKVAGPVTLDASGFRLRAEPTMWGYRPGFGGPGARGQFSMVAAATSSLIVVRNALNGRLDANSRWDLDRSIAGGVIGLHQNWDALFPAPTDSIHRNYYYTVYSLEKALDLGGIALLGAIDWYRDQAIVLVHDQGDLGSWGRKDHGVEYQEVSTAFALLFLRRATRHLRVEAQGAILTGAGGSSGTEEGRVYLPSLKGTIELKELFESLEDLRTRQYLALAKEVVESIPPEKLIDLLSYLTTVRNGSGDAADRFARQTIGTITGLDLDSDASEIATWRTTVREVRVLGDSGDPKSATRLLALLDASERSVPLSFEILRALSRIGSLDAVPPLIRFVANAKPEVGRRAHETLSALTRHGIPYPDQADAEARAALSQRWDTFWSSSGEKLIRFRRFDELRRELDSSEGMMRREQLIEEILALGPEVLVRVDGVLAQDRFAFDWLLVRERLTGERRGF